MKPGKPHAQQLDGARITGRSIRVLRTKLGLSQADLAKLLGLHTQSVYQWEHKPGALQFRGIAKAGILAPQKMGSSEVKKRLAALKEKPEKKRVRAGGRRKKEA